MIGHTPEKLCSESKPHSSFCKQHISTHFLHWFFSYVLTLYIALMYPMDWVFKKNVSQRIQNSLVLIIFPGRIFSPWSWLIRTTILDRWLFWFALLSLLVFSSFAAKFLWMDDVLLLLSYWKPFVLGLLSSKSSSSSSPIQILNRGIKRFYQTFDILYIDLKYVYYVLYFKQIRSFHLPSLFPPTRGLLSSLLSEA